jgi:hypothetical protein
MNLRETERQADEVLKNHVSTKAEFNKDEKTIVYKNFTDLLKRKRGNEKWVMFDDLYRELKGTIKSKEKLQVILEDLEQNGKLAM